MKKLLIADDSPPGVYFFALAENGCNNFCRDGMEALKYRHEQLSNTDLNMPNVTDLIN
jgi:hypothetical protein